MNTKTLITIKTFAILNLVLFLSISTIAKPVTSATGDVVKSGVKKQITATGIPNSNNTKTSGTDFNYLRFDVNEFIKTSNADHDLPENDFDYLRFDVNSFIDANELDINELPVVTDFGYLRFDVKDFSGTTSSDLDELPLN